MIASSNSDIIVKCSMSHLSNGTKVELLTLRDGQVLAINAQSMALYANHQSINDPLGNGLIHSASFPSSVYLEQQGNSWVKSYKAGYIGLVDGYTLLITPVAIQLFKSTQDALHNRGELARLDLNG